MTSPRYESEISKAKQKLRDIMAEEDGLSLEEAEKRAVDRHGNAITFDQAKKGLERELGE